MFWLQGRYAFAIAPINRLDEIRAFKWDSFYGYRKVKPKKETMRILIDVVTCAAPNQSGQKISDDDLYEIIRRRIIRALDACVENGAVNIVLGAWGCGVFRNPPKVVAEAMMREISDKYTFAFDNIVFAVYCPGKDIANYEAFEKAVLN